MNWRVKGLVQKTLSAAPGGSLVNHLLQRTVGGLRDFGREVRSKVIEDWVVLVEHMTALGVSLSGWHCMEIGTGWYPTLPICSALAGARRCVTFDRTRHLNARLTIRMVDALEPLLPQIAEACREPLADIQSRHSAFTAARSIDELLRRACIEYRAPADATVSGLADASVDLVFSNSVLEHVPADVIAKMMQESRRVLRPGGLAIHSVNCGDHYAYFDRSITAMNYYAYTDEEWRFWNTDLLYQNRLRPREFVDLAEQAGLEIVLCKWKPRSDLLAALPHQKLAPRFRHYAPEQLCSTSVDFVARKT